MKTFTEKKWAPPNTKSWVHTCATQCYSCFLSLFRAFMFTFTASPTAKPLGSLHCLLQTCRGNLMIHVARSLATHVLVGRHILPYRYFNDHYRAHIQWKKLIYLWIIFVRSEQPEAKHFRKPCISQVVRPQDLAYNHKVAGSNPKLITEISY